MKNQLELQKFLFEDNPSRLDLLNYPRKESKDSEVYTISIYRNHSFELIENTIYPYLAYSGLSVKFEYSDYDDSLSFFNMKFSGTKLSSLTCIEVSKDLGLNYIPSLLKPNLKGIIVDLDNTLYKGVLGEDGIEGITLTLGHKNLQNSLKKLKDQGFFLCVASKNNEQDVIDLFKKREDFPLSLNDFTKVYANWNSKSESIGLIANYCL